MQMERKKCQICEDPIVNGRCKLCGMPYRNDEVLYHLNENRREHYKHAGQRAKEIMRQNEVPLGEKAAKNQAVKRQAAKKQTAKSTTTPGSGKAVKKAAPPTGYNNGLVAAGNTGRIVIILILLVALGYNFITEKMQERAGSWEISNESAGTEGIVEEWPYTLAEGWSLAVDEQFSEGEYIFFCPAGNVTVQIASGDGIRVTSMSEGAQQEFTLREGDVVTLTETEYDDQELWIREK